MRAPRLIRLSLLLVTALTMLPTPASAQAPFELTTDFPAVAVEPGETATLSLDVTAASRVRVDLAVTEVPEGWTATLRGGGYIVDAVTVDPAEPPTVSLEVEVPIDARAGENRVVVTGRAGGNNVTLPIDLRVSETGTGAVELTTDAEALQGAADETFTFNLELTNNTPEETSFNLQAEGPPGWTVDARPAAQSQAATVTVPPGAAESVTVSVDPPDNVEAGDYPLGVRAVGGGRTAEVGLGVTITGNYAMIFTTPDERLNATVPAGGSGTLQLVVFNEGTAPLNAVDLTATPPADWEVTFEPESIDVVAPGQEVAVTATITPSGEAIAGDYIVSFTAATAETSESIDVRATVETSRVLGLVGILLIAAAVLGLMWVFRRYGRR